MEYYLDGREASLCKRYLAERVSELKFQIREENRRPTEKED